MGEQAGGKAALQRIRQLSSQRDALQHQVAAAQQWQARWRESEGALDEALTSRELATRCAGLQLASSRLLWCCAASGHIRTHQTRHACKICTRHRGLTAAHYS